MGATQTRDAASSTGIQGICRPVPACNARALPTHFVASRLGHLKFGPGERAGAVATAPTVRVHEGGGHRFQAVPGTCSAWASVEDRWSQPGLTDAHGTSL